MVYVFRRLSALWVLIGLFLAPLTLHAQEPLHIVVDLWPPYVIQEGDELTGADVEITKAVFASMNQPISLELLPWKRCLTLVENQQADAILDASITSEREKFLYFPEEPISNGVTVFFKKKADALPFQNLHDLKNLRVGAISGYSYCDEIDNLPFFDQFERVSSLEQNFQKLLLGRIDTLLEVDTVGYFTAKSMGISDQIEVIPNANYCQNGSYLAFAKKPGHDALAINFGKALQDFKKTDDYQQILQRYGVPASR